MVAVAAVVLGSGLCGCLIGAGPTVGVRTSGEISVGWEASGSTIESRERGGGGAQIGQSIPFGPRRSTIYFGGQGYWRVRGTLEDHAAGYAGGAGGLADREGGIQPYAGLWAMVLTSRSTLDCGAFFGRNAELTLQLGVRVIAGVGELYLAPKVNTYANFCAY
jgi:hypothetical protein